MPSATSSRRPRWRGCSAPPRGDRRDAALASAAASRSTSCATTIPTRCATAATPQETLTRLTWEAGAARAIPSGVPDKVRQRLEHELALIAELHYAPYFLTVHDIVRYARARDILCQGRGSAANSAVCFCLGITAVDPERDRPAVRALRLGRAQRAARHRRRFRARAARGGDPVDLRHYGRDRAGIAATVICYRAPLGRCARSARSSACRRT